MRIALLSDANTPGPYHHAMPLGPDGWQINGVEGLAWALEADVWHGTIADETAINTFAERYDLLLVNMKHTLWSSLPSLRRGLKDVRIVGYQEGPTDLIGRLDHWDLDQYLEALKRLDGFLCYDERGEALHRALLRGGPVATLPLPAPMAVYDKVRVPYEDRPADPPWIGIAHPVSRMRGGYISILAACEIKGARILLEGRSRREIGTVSRFIAERGGVPDVHPWLPWSPPYVGPILITSPLWSPGCNRDREQASFLRRYAQCRLAINLDPQMCYGRFAVDCAGLEIPLICSTRIVAGEALWPNSSFDHIERAIHELAYWQEYPDHPLRVARVARDLLIAYTPDSIRERFHGIMQEWGYESSADDQRE